MNMRILNAEQKRPSDNIVKNMQFNDLRGFVCFIPSVIVGEPIVIMYSNAISVRYRTSAVMSIGTDSKTGIYTIETSDASFQMLDLEKERKTQKKRIVSTLYMESRILHNPLRAVTDPDGHLFADGRYKTKIFASDLPDHYVYGYL